MTTIKNHQALAVLRVVREVGAEQVKDVKVDGIELARLDDVLEQGHKAWHDNLARKKRVHFSRNATKRAVAHGARSLRRHVRALGDFTQPVRTAAEIGLDKLGKIFIQPIKGWFAKIGERIESRGAEARGLGKLVFRFYQMAMRPVPATVNDVVRTTKVEVALKSGEAFAVRADVIDVKASLRVHSRDRNALIATCAPIPPPFGLLYGVGCSAAAAGLAAAWGKHASTKSDEALQKAYRGMQERQRWFALSSFLPGYSMGVTVAAGIEGLVRQQTLRQSTTIEQMVSLGAREPIAVE